MYNCKARKSIWYLFAGPYPYIVNGGVPNEGRQLSWVNQLLWDMMYCIESAVYALWLTIFAVGSKIIGYYTL